MGESLVTKAADAWADLCRSPAFWDVDPSTLAPTRHAHWIIARILQFGRWEDWVALFRCYTPDQIRAALQHRRVPDHVRRFWEAYFTRRDQTVNSPPHLQATGPRPNAMLGSVPGALAARVCRAVTLRASSQDLTQVYALLQAGWSLGQILDAALDHDPTLNLAHVLRSLTDFDDANQDPEPRLYRPWPWDAIQRTLQQQVHAYLRQHLPRPNPHGPRL